MTLAQHPPASQIALDRGLKKHGRQAYDSLGLYLQALMKTERRGIYPTRDIINICTAYRKLGDVLRKQKIIE